MSHEKHEITHVSGSFVSSLVLGFSSGALTMISIFISSSGVSGSKEGKTCFI